MSERTEIQPAESTGPTLNWGQAIQGLISGAGAGAAFGAEGALIGGGVGLLGGLFLGGNDQLYENDPKNWNKHTDEQFQTLSASMPDITNWLKQSLAQSGGAFTGAENLINQMLATSDDSSYDPMRGYNEYLSLAPEYQQMLAGLYQQDRDGATAQNEEMRRQLLREAQGGLDAAGINISSGAGLAALGSAAARPLHDFNMMSMNNYQNALGQGLNQLSANREQASLQDYGAQQQAYQNRVAQLMGGAQGMMSLGSSYQNEASMAAQQQMMLQQLMNQLAAPAFATNEQVISNPSQDAFKSIMAIAPDAMSNIYTGFNQV